MNDAAEALKWYFGDEKKRSPTEYYYVLRKLNNKKNPICGTNVSRELRKIRQHEQNLKRLNTYDEGSKLQRQALANRSRKVGLELVDIKEKVSMKTIDALEHVVNEKSEKMDSLLRGRKSRVSKSILFNTFT